MWLWYRTTWLSLWSFLQELYSFSFCVTISARSNHRSCITNTALNMLPLTHSNFSPLGPGRILAGTGKDFSKLPELSVLCKTARLLQPSGKIPRNICHSWTKIRESSLCNWVWELNSTHAAPWAKHKGWKQNLPNALCASHLKHSSVWSNLGKLTAVLRIKTN